MTQEEEFKFKFDFNLEQIKKAIPNVEKYSGATKKEVGVWRRVSITTLDREIKSGYGIGFVKTDGKTGAVVYPLVELAIWQTKQVIKVA